ncbi:uncharacterized protein KY384_005993 [Bacidia gigantensis]|uniref:uncharacterized protein n=1 Tax=Bacidia gigantensis TaxID=2732470 RepID=UPI001D04AF0A|nr:uncharacterized protein KY384_005993 [Bacidia gigantensis]KAG8529357.1 hypothetical protein KY384_005993 [Bacidia gigantensis]
MSGAKASLKAAKAALDAHDYQRAATEAKKAIEHDSKTYHGHVFLGLALDKQNDPESSVKAYKAATHIKEDDPLAWQGLVSLFENHAGKMLDQYHDAALSLAELYAGQDDKFKCQTVIDKYMLDAKKYGSRSQFKQSLETILPGSPVFEYLEGRIPQPAYTYCKLADVIEAEEKERLNFEIGQRRTRLGARIDQVTLEVKREILENSVLGDVYSHIINWSQDDEIRRTYEEKQLQHAGDTLAALPLSRKHSQREDVMKMARGLVILKHPFLLAWKIVLEWNDVDEIAELDIGLLRDFTILFPEEGLAKVCKGYLLSEISPFPNGRSNDTDGEKQQESNDYALAEDRLILMTEGLDDAKRSILAHRLMGQHYLYLDEYEDAVNVSKEGLERLVAEANLMGLSLPRTADAINSTLATALVHHQSPRHHADAQAIFQTILDHRANYTAALIGIGLIYEEEENYAEALNFLSRSLEKSHDPKVKAEAAWCKALMGDNGAAFRELEVCLSDMNDSDPKTRSLRAQTLYRIGMCMWRLESSRARRKDRNGSYARFLASLQADMNFAPAYTSLGIFYAEYARDRKRAKRCFHKAFELSASELDAAYRLAESFAQTDEWESVEAVAQRVIDSGKIKPPPGSRKKPISWPFATLGVVQLNNQEYGKAVVSFQSALRASPTDYNCWVGLAESYHNSGRYIAATKAFEHAKELEQGSHADSGWFTEYMLANVKRELGDFDEAIYGYRSVLKNRSSEFGVSLALLQTLVESAWRSIELGFFGRAAERAKEAILFGQDVVRIRSHAFNLWKAVGDACSVFLSVQGHASIVPWTQLGSLMLENSEALDFDIMSDIDDVNVATFNAISTSNGEESSGARTACAAILAYKRAINASAHDVHARAVAWYNLGWAEHKAHASKVVDRHESKHLRAAVQCFKRAIEFEAGNAEFWNALGIVTCDLSPKVAQHSFVRSLYLNDKNARVWTNLGTLYLLQDDRQLAAEAFTRAQSGDPSFAQAWLGQGLLPTQSSDQADARYLFTHAFEIADSTSTLVKLLYSRAVFDHAVSSRVRASELLQPLLSLHHLQLQTPSDMASQHLLSLFAERIGNFDDANSSVNRLCSKLETEYESSESLHTLSRFAQLKSDGARTQLARNHFSNAADDSSTALDLTEDEEQVELRPQIRLSAHMTAGLACSHQRSDDESIDMFKSALSETHGNPDIVCLLAQVLWAKGEDNERAVAREQLLDCIERYPGHVGATSMLGCIAILFEDEEILDAVVQDLSDMRTNDSLSLQERSKIAILLNVVSSLHTEPDGQRSAELSQANTTIMLSPSHPHGWSQLAALSHEAFPAEAAILVASKAATPKGNLEASDLCLGYAGTRRPDDAQRAIMLAPYSASGWEALC